MTVIYPTKNYTEDEDKNRPDSLGYDLASEKKMVAEATEKIKKELIDKWKKKYNEAKIFPEKISKLHPELLNLLLAFKNTLFYNDLAKTFSLTQEQRNILPRIVWEACVSGNLDNFSTLCGNKLNIDQQKTQEITDQIEKEILSKARVLLSKPLKPQVVESKKIRLNKLTLAEAIRQYPKVAEQPITGSPIKIKSFPAPARPSVKNWITDYRENLGSGRHGMVERGNYLFQTENTKRISSAERQRLAWVLKSLEENLPMDIDSENEIIIFPDSRESNKGSVLMSPAQEAPRAAASYSSPNTVPLTATSRPMGVNEAAMTDAKNENLAEAPVKISPPVPRSFPYKKEIGISGEKKVHYQKPAINKIEPIGDADEDGNIIDLRS